VKAARETFHADQLTLRAEDLIAIDEMGVVTGMSRAYGYAPQGERAFSSEPAAKGTRLNVIGALSSEGFLGGLEVTGSVNGDVFEAFIEQIVVPHLRPGKVVILDNVPFHYREGIRDTIESTGARTLFLPAYSPELNPIEECWSKVKAWIKKCAPRTVKALQEAITEAIQQVTTGDAEGWFRHAGYLFNTDE
jgi:transposase